ncbi:nitrous oxidase accessory protein [Thermoplasmatales archaeon SCGC AB-540-F20]|nr:nitrous oxidase accessory protein [Thermoplasmatales archaeon SCGC AB-540-F20]
MQNSEFRKGLVLAIILLFVGACVIPSTVGFIEEKTTSTNASYDGYIQDLIDNASVGDTIYVPSGMYYENIIINKSISLIGEDKNTTIIDGGGSGDIVRITAYWVTISGFTIQYSGDGWNNAGITIRSEYNSITDNIIKNNVNGINLMDSNINITSNTISDNKEYGISSEGLYTNNIIMGNNITNNKYGIALSGIYNKALENNFINNKVQAFWVHILNGGKLGINKWKNNYWNRPRILPKLILGIIGDPPSPNMIWFAIDWHPAQEPYDIEV